ncbi:hypothetical protein EHM69_00990 [candidate division KSB1 bacterium]|nr:MAG: hypothetical protein EHM69_00990 [candidate division KSB1 bacterium]
MKATTEYLKRLLEENRRINREAQFRLQQIKDYDFDTYVFEPPDMPDWAKALRAHNNNVRTVHLP